MRSHEATSTPSPCLERRELCLGLLAAGVALGCGGGGGSSATTPAQATGTGLKTTTDTRAQLLTTPLGTVRDYRNLGSFLLVRDGGGIYAMSAVCTHLGCTVALPVDSRITCPCHGSQYDLGGGNLVGPAASPLVHYAVAEPTPGGVLTVDTNRTVAASVRLV